MGRRCAGGKSQEVEKAGGGGAEDGVRGQLQFSGSHKECGVWQTPDQTCRDRISLWDVGFNGSLGRLGCGYSSGSMRL